jgi:hypothetical protein
MAEMIGNGTASQAEREDRKEQRASPPAKVSDADDFDEVPVVMPPGSTDGGLSSRAARPRRRVPRDCDALERDRAREALVELGLGVVDSGKTDLVTVSTADLESGPGTLSGGDRADERG